MTTTQNTTPKSHRAAAKIATAVTYAELLDMLGSTDEIEVFPGHAKKRVSAHRAEIVHGESRLNKRPTAWVRCLFQDRNNYEKVEFVEIGRYAIEDRHDPIAADNIPVFHFPATGMTVQAFA